VFATSAGAGAGAAAGVAGAGAFVSGAGAWAEVSVGGGVGASFFLHPEMATRLIVAKIERNKNGLGFRVFIKFAPIGLYKVSFLVLFQITKPDIRSLVILWKPKANVLPAQLKEIMNCGGGEGAASAARFF
jgi:hypothetical protein